MARISVIGAGSWGTALGRMLGVSGHAVRLWSHNPVVAEQIRGERVNREYLPGFEIPETVEVTCEIGAALGGAEIVVLAVPSHALRETVQASAGAIPGDALVVSATKGLEVDTLRRPTEVIEEQLAGSIAPVALSGPSFAREVAGGLPTAVTAASSDPDGAREVQEVFSTDRFRIYTNQDVGGVELGGALKNVIALAAGIADGLEYGSNGRAALITRGLAEITRLGVSLDAQPQTFAGLAGLGDLVLTCTGDLSRNRTVGLRLGRGESLEQILTGMKMVAEGVRTSKAARQLAHRQEVEMPIVEQVCSILFDGKSPERATADLLLREPKPEYW